MIRWWKQKTTRRKMRWAIRQVRSMTPLSKFIWQVNKERKEAFREAFLEVMARHDSHP